MDARSKPYFFAFDAKSKPGKVVAHCVRIETLEMDVAAFKETTFTYLGVDYDKDPRVRDLLVCAYRFIRDNEIHVE